MTNDSPRQKHDERPSADVSHSLADIAAQGGGDLRVDGPAAHGIALSTGGVRAGDLFVAAAGASTHGARFAADALAAGAVAVLTDPAGAEFVAAGVPLIVVEDPRAVLGRLSAWFYDFPAAALKTIGVTGTQGKTSTTFLIDAALGERRSGLIGSMGSKIDGIPVPTKLTTPEAPALHALLAKMREEAVTWVSAEVSSQAITMRRVDGMVFDVAVFLNLGHDHLDFHGSQENYRAAKRELLTPAMSRLALVNIDDQAGRRFHDDPELHTESFSITGRDADWRAVDIDLGPDGSAFTVVGPEGQSARFTTPIIGTFTVSNILAAVAALDRVGYPLERSIEGLADFTGPEGRVQFVPVDADFRVVIDAGHKPEAINALLCALRPATPGRIITVIGSNGNRDAHKRPLMGRFSAMASDVVVVTDDNPADEDPAMIRRAVVAGTRGSSAHVFEVAGRAEAIHHAVDLAEAGDLLVIVGKGDERHQITARGIVPHSDPDEVEWALARKRARQA